MPPADKDRHCVVSQLRNALEYIFPGFIAKDHVHGTALNRLWCNRDDVLDFVFHCILRCIVIFSGYTAIKYVASQAPGAIVTHVLDGGN